MTTDTKDAKMCTASHKDAFNFDHAALLVLNYQNVFYNKVGKPTQALENTKAAVAAFRKAKMPVLYTRVEFRKEYHSLAESNKVFLKYKVNGQTENSTGPKLILGSEEVALVEGIKEESATEPILVHRRLSAFHNSELLSILSAKNIKHLVIAGLSTSEFVRATVSSASDHDFLITVLEDACADCCKDTQASLMKGFACAAEVTSTKAFVAHKDFTKHFKN